MPPAFGQFAFLIGGYDAGIRNWDADARDWSDPQFFTRWNDRYIFGVRAIADEWRDHGYGSREQSGGGVNICIFDPEKGRWETTWRHTANQEIRELQLRGGG